MQTRLSIIIPIYNEAGNLPELYERLSSTAAGISPDYEIIFVNDHSMDLSHQIIDEIASQDSKVKYIHFSRNFGHQIAVTAGLDKSKGELVVIIDGDLQDPPELITQLYHKHLEGYDVVYAKRNKREGETGFKKLTAKYFYRLLNKLTYIKIPVDTGDFRLITRKVVEGLKDMPEHNKFLRGQIAWLGLKQTEVLYDRDARKHGETGYSLSKMIKFAMDGIIGFSDRPLIWVTRSGFFIAFISFCIIVYAVYSHFFLHRTITGWTSLILSVAFMGGVQLMCLGILGEYISRIHSNTQDRPLYVIDDEN